MHGETHHKLITMLADAIQVEWDIQEPHYCGNSGLVSD